MNTEAINKLVDAATKAGREAERERIAQLVDDFHWTLPMYENTDVNIASDDAAESVKVQIAAAIRQGS